MAAIVYNADGYLASQAITDQGLGFDITATFSRVMNTTGLLITDFIRLAKLPKGAIIFDWFLFVPALDSSTGLLLSLGLGGNATLDNTGAVLAAATPTAFLSSTTIGRAGGHVTPMESLGISGTTPIAPVGIVAAALPAAALTCDQDLILTYTAAATGSVAGGTLRGFVKYHMHAPSAVF